MKRILARFTGISLILASILGLVVSIGGILFMFQYKQSIQTQIVTMIDLMDSTLAITSDGFQVVNDALVKSSESTILIGKITTDLGNSIGSSSPALNSVSELIGTELVTMIDGAETSLSSAQASAKMIDDTLKMLSLFGLDGGAYKGKQKPLADSLGEIAGSMEKLPTSLKQIQKDISNTTANLAVMQKGIYDLSDSINSVDSTIGNAKIVINQYSDTVKNLRAMTSNLKKTLPSLLDKGLLGVALLLLWMMIAQLGLFTQGLELLTRRYDTVLIPATIVSPAPEKAEAGDSKKIPD